MYSLGDKTVGEEAVQEGAVSQAQEKACLTAATGCCQAVFAGQGRLNPGLEKTRVFYVKKTSPVGFLVFLGFVGFLFLFIYLPRRESFGGFPVSRILLDASRL